jgi:ABC-2 type transport system ATP-binding protein
LRAVDDISFAVEPGEIFGFLGPNGAGKTTTIKVLTGQLRPTSGTARVMGCDVVTQRQQLKPQIGVVFEYQNIYERLSARDNLTFAARLYGVDKGRVDAVLRQVGLVGRERERVSKYSNGMKQRLLVARALLHEPRVLFLDEPTRGLDPGVAREIRAIIAELAQQGTAVFLTTHYMEEADQLSRRVAIIDQGRIVALDAPGSLKASHGQRQVVLALKSGETVTLALDDEADARRLAELAASGTVQTMRTTEATLEDVFLKLTGRSLG